MRPERPIPKTLTSDELYALCAYILALNNIIGEDEVMDANTLPQVEMPNRDNFIIWDPDTIGYEPIRSQAPAIAHRGSSGCIAGNGYPDAPVGPLVSYQINRQLFGWLLPPLMIRAFEAHCQGRKVPSDMIHPGLVGQRTVAQGSKATDEDASPGVPHRTRV